MLTSSINKYKPQIIDLRGLPSDFGLCMESGEIATTETLVTRFNIIPGTQDARGYWLAVEENARSTNKYGGQSITFGAGGLSSLIYDKLIIYYGMDQRTAHIALKLHYLTQDTIDW